MYCLFFEGHILDLKKRSLKSLYGRDSSDFFYQLFNSYLLDGGEITTEEIGQDCYTLQIKSMTLKVKNSKLVEFEDLELESIAGYFLYLNTSLVRFSAPKIKSIAGDFLHDNTSLTHFSAPKLRATGDNFLKLNSVLVDFSAPELREVGSKFLVSHPRRKEWRPF